MKTVLNSTFFFAKKACKFHSWRAGMNDKLSNRESLDNHYVCYNFSLHPSRSFAP